MALPSINFWLERLMPKRRSDHGSAQHRVPFQYILQNIPHHRVFPVDYFLGRLNGLCDPPFDELADNERQKSSAAMFFGKAALVQFFSYTLPRSRNGRSSPRACPAGF